MATRDEVRWLSPDERRAWMPLMAMLMTLQPALDAQLKRDEGINTFEYMTMAALSEAPNRTMQMSDLATFAQGSLSRLSHAVSRLEKAGWVVRQPGTAGGRHTNVHLTAAGWRKVQHAAPGHVREVRRLVIDAISPEALDVMGAASRDVFRATVPELAEELDRRIDS